jgi:hypothetical protein
MSRSSVTSQQHPGKAIMIQTTAPASSMLYRHRIRYKYPPVHRNYVAAALLSIGFLAAQWQLGPQPASHAPSDSSSNPHKLSQTAAQARRCTLHKAHQQLPCTNQAAGCARASQVRRAAQPQAAPPCMHASLAPHPAAPGSACTAWLGLSDAHDRRARPACGSTSHQQCPASPGWTVPPG